MEATKRRPGRPCKPDAKRVQALRLHPQVIEIVKRRGTAWVEDVLRAAD